MSEHLYDFAHPLTGGTVRSCLDCGLPVYGGPTRCVPCATGRPDDARASVEDFVTGVTCTLRERNRNLHGVLDRIERAVGVPTQAATNTADAVEDTIARLTRERDALHASRALCIEALRGVQAVGDVDEQTWDVVADGIAALRARAESAEREAATLRLMLRETAATNTSGIAYALRCQRERDEARASLATLHRRTQEAERLLGLAMRVGYATCWPLRSERDHLMRLWRQWWGERDAARRWSRLWHRCARRLWQEIHGPGVAVNPDAYLRGLE